MAEKRSKGKLTQSIYQMKTEKLKFVTWSHLLLNSLLKFSMLKTSHFCPLQADTKWTWDLCEGLQEVLCLSGVPVGEKYQPIFKARSTDHAQATHLPAPVSNLGVVVVLDHRGEKSLNSNPIIFCNFVSSLKNKRTRIVPILVLGKSSLPGGLFHSNSAASCQSSVPISPTPPWHFHSYTIIYTI